MKPSEIGIAENVLLGLPVPFGDTRASMVG